VAGNQFIKRLLHLFEAAQAMLRVPVEAGNALRHGRVHAAVPGQKTQKGAHVWHGGQTRTETAGFLHRQDRL
jgi:hypothetical protein